jgi:hypothetical protein
MESYANIKDGHEVPEEYQDLWVGIYYEYDPELLLKLLREWKEKTPPKKVLESLKRSIDYYYDDIYELFDCTNIFFKTIPNKLIELIMINLLNEEVKKEINLELIELFIYFNAHLGEKCSKIINDFKYLIKINNLLLDNLSEEKYISSLDYFLEMKKTLFLKDQKEKLFNSWIYNNLYKPERLISVFNNIINKNPPKSVLLDLKNKLNTKYHHFHHPFKNFVYLIVNNIINYDFICEGFEINPEESYLLIKNFIHFGAIINQEHIDLLKDIIPYITKVVDIYEKAVSGRKIVKFIKDKIDDEFELKPLRMKLDLKRFQNLMKEKEELPH